MAEVRGTKPFDGGGQELLQVLKTMKLVLAFGLGLECKGTDRVL